MCCDIQDYLKYRCHLSDMENNMRKYIPLVLFIFSWPVLCADIHGRVVRVLDGDTIEVMDSRKEVRIRLINSKRLARTVLIFTESSDQLSRATDRVPGLPASPGYAQ